MTKLETVTEDRLGELAAALVEELGIHDAAVVCVNNHWYGVLDRILRTDPPQ